MRGQVQKLAEEVRAEAERWAREKGEDPSLLLWCAVTSIAFVALADEAGIKAEIAGGTFLAEEPPDPHFWALAWEDRPLLVDLTLTQYIPDAPPAAVLDEDHPMLHAYGMIWVGPPTRKHVCASDAADAEVLIRKVRARRAEAACSP